LGHTSLNLTQGSLDDTLVHHLDLLVHTRVVITGVVDEHNAHEAVQVIWVLSINGDPSFVLEGLTDSTLEKILVELRKEQGVEWCLTLFEGIEVEVVTHLI
jgi:hypothetical protein